MLGGSGVKRSDRVGERIKAELMDMLLRGSIHDPAAAGVYLTQVVLSGDLRYARVYVRLTDSDAPDAARVDAVKALNRAAGFIRRSLSPRLQLKYLPELRFFWDDTVDRAARIEAVLAQIDEPGGEQS